MCQEWAEGTQDRPTEEPESLNSGVNELADSGVEPAENAQSSAGEDEDKMCPSCGRAVAMKSRTRCAYCDAELPWANSEASEEQKSPRLNIAELLGGSDMTRQMAMGISYPMACGACGGSLSEEKKPAKCPGCHAMVRDPYTGRLIYGKETGMASTSMVRPVFLTVLLFACACAALYLFKLLSKLTPP